jgi:2,3-bisphosphoglycerate-dependent phosphoglycerate mutase
MPDILPSYMSPTLILLRHGQSVWNREGIFTGCEDVDITPQGRSEATYAGELLLSKSLLPQVVHTSLLRRAISTANICLDTCGRHWIPVQRSWRLNERHYGALQGRKKAEVAHEVGQDQVATWRRSFDVPPPSGCVGQNHDPRYAMLNVQVPEGESLENVVDRLIPYWNSELAQDLRSDKIVLVVAHGNSLRALIKVLDKLTAEEIMDVDIPTGIPIVYQLDDNLNPLIRGGTAIKV